jgi:Cu+-exporting ATPase
MIETTALGAETVLSRIIGRRRSGGQGTDPKNWWIKVSRINPMLLIALATFDYLVSRSAPALKPPRWNAVAVLVIACSMRPRLSHAHRDHGWHRRGSANGILIKDAEALEVAHLSAW